MIDCLILYATSYSSHVQTQQEHNTSSLSYGTNIKLFTLIERSHNNWINHITNVNPCL